MTNTTTQKPNWFKTALSLPFLIILTSIFQTVFISLYWLLGGHTLAEIESPEFMANGNVVVYSTTTFFISILFFLGIWFGGIDRQISWKQQLAFRPVDKVKIAKLLFILFIAINIWDLITHLIGRPIVTDFVKMATSTSSLPTPFLWIAIVVLAPIGEELLYRGFLFFRFNTSPLGPLAAIILTSLMWTLTHFQYGPWELTAIFLLGLFLGFVRHKTNSIWPPIILHCFNNSMAMIQQYIYN